MRPSPIDRESVGHWQNGLVFHQTNPFCHGFASPQKRSHSAFRRDQDTQRFEEIKTAEDVNLPQIMFLSLKELLSGLLDVANMKDVSLWEGSAFLDYVNTRKSHSRLAVEPSLVENEIGGVIVGSLRAAQAGRALTRAEYLSDKRSNVDNKTDQGCQLRERVYDEYQLFAKWKRGQGGLLDINDVVLRLLEIGMDQLFQSGKSSSFSKYMCYRCVFCLSHRTVHFATVYLDEVQDFTYASIFLICFVSTRSLARTGL